MLCNCRVANLAYMDGLDPGNHILLSDKIQICPLCGISDKWAFHGPSNDAAGSAIECCNCNNYVKYYFSVDHIDDLEYARLDKEEFYIKKYCVIQEDDTMIILNDLVWVCEIPAFSFRNAEHLLKRIQTYITFM